MNDGLLRVFWPYGIAQSTAPGVVVGWRNSESDIFVVSVLDHVEVSMDSALLKDVRITNGFRSYNP